MYKMGTISNSSGMPKECSEQWEVLLLLMSSEETKIDRSDDDEIDTMFYFCRSEGVKKILLEWLQSMQTSYAKKISDQDTALKCDEISLLWRQKGNDHYRANHIEDSYQCYTKSVLYAKQDGLMFPLALANRSAALLRMKNYKDCLADLALAIDHGYPKKQQHKLLIRRCDCFIELGLRTNAESSLSDALEHAAALNLSPDHVGDFGRHVKVLEKKLEVMVDKAEERPDVLPLCYQGNNHDFYAASNAIDLCRSERAGRYVTAGEPLRRGDVLFSEDPYAWVTLPGDIPVCETCCRGNINSVPCTVCSRSIYCGLACRKRGNMFHRFECMASQLKLFPTIGIAHLALRVLLITTTNGFPQIPSSHRAPSTAAELFTAYSDVDSIKIYHKDTPAFYRMFNLVTNFDKMDSNDYVQYALTSMMMTIYLETFTDFFEYLPSRVPYKMPAIQLRYFVASFLLRCMGQLVCNGHATLSLEVFPEPGTGGRTLTEREVRRATAIYPSAAMMNHSCDPNIVNTFYNNRLIIRCARDTKAGDEIFNCYGPHRARSPTAQRRKDLHTQYCFNCNCVACSDPEHKDFVLLFTAYACQSCKGPVIFTAESKEASCQQCGVEFPLSQALAAIDRAQAIAAQADLVPSMAMRCERLQTALRMKQQVWHRHHSGLRTAADKLARVYADAGEFNKSVELIKHNIQSLEYQFGSFSVEVAHELRKLSEVMVERILSSPQNPEYRDWCLETHKIIKKAVQLMELNYGSWEPLVKRLCEQEDLVATLLAEAPEDPVDWIHNKLHYNLKI